MRTRQRLIEVLDSVNGLVVGFNDRTMAYFMSQWLKQGNSLWSGDVTPYYKDYITREVGSPHIRELLTEGLAILEADKLTGCRA